MIIKKKSTYLETPIGLGDIIKEYYIDEKENKKDPPNYYLIIDVLDKSYLTLDIESGEIVQNDFRYHPEVQQEKVG